MATPTPHPSLTRLYEAAKSLSPPVQGKSAVAAWLNVSPQMVNNWEKRGVSRSGALAAQSKSGYSATWILEGSGDPKVNGQPAKGAFLKAITPEMEELLAHFQHLLTDDKKRLLAEVSALAATREAERREILAEAGMGRIMQKAADATRGRRAQSSVDVEERLRQGVLPLQGSDDKSKP